MNTLGSALYARAAAGVSLDPAVNQAHLRQEIAQRLVDLQQRPGFRNTLSEQLLLANEWLERVLRYLILDTSAGARPDTHSLYDVLAQGGGWATSEASGGGAAAHASDEVPCGPLTAFLSEGRKAALSLCGWSPLPSPAAVAASAAACLGADSLAAVAAQIPVPLVQRCCADGDVERGAAIALLHGFVAATVRILTLAADETRGKARAAAAAAATVPARAAEAAALTVTAELLQLTAVTVAGCPGPASSHGEAAALVPEAAGARGRLGTEVGLASPPATALALPPAAVAAASGPGLQRLVWISSCKALLARVDGRRHPYLKVILTVLLEVCEEGEEEGGATGGEEGSAGVTPNSGGSSAAHTALSSIAEAAPAHHASGGDAATSASARGTGVAASTSGGGAGVRSVSPPPPGGASARQGGRAADAKRRRAAAGAGAVSATGDTDTDATVATTTGGGAGSGRHSKGGAAPPGKAALKLPVPGGRAGRGGPHRLDTLTSGAAARAKGSGVGKASDDTKAAGGGGVGVTSPLAAAAAGSRKSVALKGPAGAAAAAGSKGGAAAAAGAKSGAAPAPAAPAKAATASATSTAVVPAAAASAGTKVVPATSAKPASAPSLEASGDGAAGQDHIEISLHDRVGFACRFLDDDQLPGYIATITAEVVAAGRIDGLLLTGLTPVGAQLVQQYLDATADVQSAATVGVFTLRACQLHLVHAMEALAHGGEAAGVQAGATTASLLSADQRAMVASCWRWVVAYREVLVRSQLWYERSLFDVQRSKTLAAQHRGYLAPGAYAAAAGSGGAGAAAYGGSRGASGGAALPGSSGAAALVLTSLATLAASPPPPEALEREALTVLLSVGMSAAGLSPAAPSGEQHAAAAPPRGPAPAAPAGILAFLPQRSQMHVRCPSCRTSLSLPALVENSASAVEWLSKQRPQMLSCPSCKKTLPRCCLCLMPMGCINPVMQLQQDMRARNAARAEAQPMSFATAAATAAVEVATGAAVTPEALAGGGSGSSTNPPPAAAAAVGGFYAGAPPGQLRDSMAVDDFWTWCQACKHGGHASHLAEWFATQTVCPVSQCPCHCMQMDAAVRKGLGRNY